ncbi:MAG: radical SAM protein [Pyrinomonadaceae bacterium]|nr:radical SAM protein [Pyrinomonadaceae bacterium]
MNLTYAVEADWTLLTTCNFRCPYCFFPPADLGAKLLVHGTHAQWVEGFNATRKTWLLHITGGEPSIYPGFVDLCEHLTRDHYLSINSNLSHRCIDLFAERIDPQRVHYINAAVHYAERQKRASLDVFVERVHKLQAHEFNVLVSAVMTPMMVGIFPELSEYFERRDLFLIPKVMRGSYEGREYPASYSDAQRSLIIECLVEARQKYATVLAEMGERPTIDMFSDDRFLNSTGDYQGRLCGSGYNFVQIQPDGAVFRCESGERLGNVLQKDVKLLRSPKRCDTSYCPYFCEKYTSPQFAQAQRRPHAFPLRSLPILMRQVFKS